MTLLTYRSEAEFVETQLFVAFYSLVPGYFIFSVLLVTRG